MHAPETIGPGIHVVAGPGITTERDAYAYLAVGDRRAALIDAGAEPDAAALVRNVGTCLPAGMSVSHIIATHAHIDHVGGLAAARDALNAAVVIHAGDAPALARGDPVFSAARWYGLDLTPVTAEHVVHGSEERLDLGGVTAVCVHAPGHTPGSMAVYMDRDGKRYLFGQDIHGPFSPDFRSDREAWRRSMKILLDLEADVLAEGHYGIIHGKEETARFIRRFLDQFRGRN